MQKDALDALRMQMEGQLQDKEVRAGLFRGGPALWP